MRERHPQSLLTSVGSEDLEYLLVKWIHDYPDMPVCYYCEIDDERWEVRKVEIYADKRVGWADADREVGGSIIAEKQIPTLNEIAEITEEKFEPKAITKEEFERVWQRAMSETPEEP